MQFLCSAEKLSSITRDARLLTAKVTVNCKQQMINMLNEKLMNKQSKVSSKQKIITGIIFALTTKLIQRQTTLLQVQAQKQSGLQVPKQH